MSFFVGLTFDLKSKLKSKGKRRPCIQGRGKLIYKKPPACRLGGDDFLAEFDAEDTISSIENALAIYGHSVIRIGSAKSLVLKLRQLRCDIVFNIAEGTDGRNRESQVPAILDAANIPYVGSDAVSLAVSLDKVVAKKIFSYHKIPTPGYFECKDEHNIVVPEGLNFPLLVKPRYEGSAKGITLDSKVKNLEELKCQVERIIRTYNQPALIEEFITGYEFTVGIIGNEHPFILPVVQRYLEVKTNLSSHIFEKCGYDTGRLKYQKPLEIEGNLESRIKRLALDAFYAVGCQDVARVDLRVDERGVYPALSYYPEPLLCRKGGVYVLEINPLPSLARDDYFALSAESLGMTYDEIINMILESALKRHKCSQKTYTHIQNIAK